MVFNKTIKSFYFWLMIFLLKLPGSYGKSAFVIMMDTIKCRANPDYAYPPNCSIDKSHTPERGFFDMQMRREVKVQKYSLNLTLISNKRRRNIVSVKNWDACAFFEGRISSIIKSLKDVVDDFGNLPKKCPVDKDFHYVFKDVHFDMRKFPPYMLEADFQLVTRNTAGKDFLFIIETAGRLRRIEVEDDN